jgi:Concanavalin A-like lectin/glucanases superfamily
MTWRTRTVGTFASLVMVAALAVWVAVPAGAAATSTLAYWQMNEKSGATTMIDSSGHGLNGTIGSDVIVGATYNGATGYRWAFTSPTAPPAKPGRLVLVKHDNRFNPGSGDYAVTIRYRTNQHFGNIIQKGQGGATGGYFKLENPNGILTCVFRGRSSSGTWLRKQVTSGTPLSDNQWHTVRCERTANALTLTVDGSVRGTAKGSSGNIYNTRPISIAGKYNCDNIKTTCDYFTGDIDWIQIQTG